MLATQLTLAQGDLRAVLRSRPNAHDLWIVSRSLLSEQRTAALTTLLEEVAPELNLDPILSLHETVILPYLEQKLKGARAMVTTVCGCFVFCFFLGDFSLLNSTC